MNNAVDLFKNMLSMGTDPRQVEKMILAQNPQLQDRKSVV